MVKNNNTFKKKGWSGLGTKTQTWLGTQNTWLSLGKQKKEICLDVGTKNDSVKFRYIKTFG